MVNFPFLNMVPCLLCHLNPVMHADRFLLFALLLRTMDTMRLQSPTPGASWKMWDSLRLQKTCGGLRGIEEVELD